MRKSSIYRQTYHKNAFANGYDGSIQSTSYKQHTHTQPVPFIEKFEKRIESDVMRSWSVFERTHSLVNDGKERISRRGKHTC